MFANCKRGECLKKINVEKHQLVPKHIILSEEERSEILKKYKISLRQLPRILITDPAIADKNPKVGDVVKIVRKSPTAGEAIYYRVVVKG
ncbi:MAG: DNA-directed RNA polymerase subunit H [Candidatus Aenigmatarchaeota archaeon]